MFLCIKNVVKSFIQINKMWINIVVSGTILINVCTLALANEPHGLAEAEKRCEQGVIKDCINLSRVYFYGKFNNQKIEIDNNRADYFTQRAVQNGQIGCKVKRDMESCYTLGVYYFEGDPIKRDFKQGMDLVTQACRGGYQEACTWLDWSGVKIK